MINPVLIAAAAWVALLEKLFPLRLSLGHDYDLPLQDVEDEVWEGRTGGNGGDWVEQRATPGSVSESAPRPSFKPAASHTAAEAAGVDHTPLGDPPAAPNIKCWTHIGKFHIN